MTKDTYQRALTYSLRLLKIRQRSKLELQNKLKEKRYSESTIKEVICELEKSGYLDDLKFAKSWVQDRMNFNPKAPMALRLELKKKGVTDNIINNVLKNFQNQYDLRKIAYELTRRRTRLLKRGIETEKAKRRIFDYLRRRGFNSGLIYEILNNMFKKNEDR